MIRTSTLLLLAVLAPLSGSCTGSPTAGATCSAPGQWLAADASGSPLAVQPLLERMAGQQVVLLGEAHDSAEDHRWQLHVLAQLHSRRPQLAVAFEMFPRRLQAVLDQWVAGTLSEQEFLRRSEWDKVWAYDPRDYLPLFHYARMNRIPMLAVNVERSLPEAIGKQGWDAVPEGRKEGVSRPAQPGKDYVKDLRLVFEHHPARERGESAFPFFVEAQTAWDRAMAQGMADHLGQQPQALVVGIMGAGHVRHGRGVAHQLRDLGIERIGTLLTWDHERPCGDIAGGLADALYVVRQGAAPAPRLGVTTDALTGGELKIVQVAGGSIAERAGIRGGDVIVDIAGRKANGLQMLRQVVQRQPAGTWLPLKVRRGEEIVELVARFPAEE